MSVRADAIQSLWVKGSLSRLEQLVIASFLENGHEFHLYTYDQVSGVPAGAQIIDAREILPEDRVFTRKDGWGGYANFSDLFRYHLLHKRGGWCT